MASRPATTDSGARTETERAEQLGAEITELCSYLYAAEARLLQLIREFDQHRYWAKLGLCSCAHWLNFKCGIGMNAAREKLRVALALADLPKIDAAFAKGELSYSKVRAMTRIADKGNEDYLLMIARHGTAHHVEKLVAKYRVAKRLQDADAVNAQYRDRELTHYYDQDGCLVIKARLPAEQGALIVKALEKAMDRSFATARGGDGTEVTAATSPLEDGPDVTAETSEPEPLGARRADALADIAETYLNNDDASGSTADRYQVVVHVTAETSHLEDGPHVTAETARRIGCDGSVVTVKEGVNGEPLSIGRRSRTIPAPMRRALRARDGGCRFPGCTHTRFIDGHHIRHWADGGDTGLDNLVMLCRHHHRLVHEGGFACEQSESGEIYFTDQRQQRLPARFALPGVASAQQLQAWLDSRFFAADIDSDACTAKWYAGDRMDWQMAVSALF
jgi:hypothetical protein